MTDKSITVARLKEILEELKPDMLINVNQVSNLSVLSGEGSYLGYIDLYDSTLDLFKEEV